MIRCWWFFLFLLLFLGITSSLPFIFHTLFFRFAFMSVVSWIRCFFVLVLVLVEFDVLTARHIILQLVVSFIFFVVTSLFQFHLITSFLPNRYRHFSGFFSLGAFYLLTSWFFSSRSLSFSHCVPLFLTSFVLCRCFWCSKTMFIGLNHGRQTRSDKRKSNSSNSHNNKNL